MKRIISISINSVNIFIQPLVTVHTRKTIFHTQETLLSILKKVKALILGIKRN